MSSSPNLNSKRVKKLSNDTTSGAPDDLLSLDLKNMTSFSTKDNDLSASFARSGVMLVEHVVVHESPLAFVLLSKEECEELLQDTFSEIESKLQTKFQLNSETHLKDSAVLDYYVEAVQWCQQQQYNSLQLSIFFTIIYTLLKKLEEEQLSLVNLISEFHKMLFESGEDPRPLNQRFFKIQQAKAIIGYVNSSLFKQYNLYLYVMTTSQAEQIITDDLSIEPPLALQAPLDEGLPEEVLNRRLSIETPVIVSLEEEQEHEEVVDKGIEFSPEIEDIFGVLTHEDIRSVIDEALTTVLSKLQTSTEDKIQQQQMSSMAKIDKVYIVQS